MELAPDFFSYFDSAGSLLAGDPTLYCVSSWNDHGQAAFVRDERRLYRSDFFPGLGWMLTKALWTELRCRSAPISFRHPVAEFLSSVSLDVAVVRKN